MISKKKKKKKKKKKVFAKIQSDFSPKFRKFKRLRGALFVWGGGYFPFFTENRPQKHKIHAFLHTSQANGYATDYPGYATDGHANRGRAVKKIDATYARNFNAAKLHYSSQNKLILDDIKFIVPPIWPYILERKFNALLENGVHFVNIVGEKGSNLPLSTPTMAAFASFF